MFNGKPPTRRLLAVIHSRSSGGVAPASKMTRGEQSLCAVLPSPAARAWQQAAVEAAAPLSSIFTCLASATGQILGDRAGNRPESPHVPSPGR